MFPILQIKEAERQVQKNIEEWLVNQQGMGKLPWLNLGVTPKTVLLLTMMMTALFAAANGEDEGGCHKPLSEAADQPDIVRIVEDKEEADLRVVVPNISIDSMRQFVNCSDPTKIKGYCISLFEASLISILQNESISMAAISGGAANLRDKRPFRIHYTCINFTTSANGSSMLTYNDMVQAVADGVYDVVVGDVTIGASRMSKIDFTQKYMESGIVIVTKQQKRQNLNSWTLFICPFTVEVWLSALGAFTITAIMFSAIEYKRHMEFKQDSTFKIIGKIFWLILEVMILFKRESVKSSIGQLIMMTWVFIALLFGAIYTAGLTSFLTTSNLSTTELDINSLKTSGQLIGYRKGSIVRDFLTTRFQIPESQLLPIRETSNFRHNLTNGLPIVDELPYANIILSTMSSSKCNYEISKSFTSEGFGFGFNNETKLANTFSVAILNLIESGCIQSIEEKYGMTNKLSCPSTPLEFTPITFKSSLILFVPLLFMFILCILILIIKRFCQCHQICGRNARIDPIDDPISIHGENDTIHMIRQRNHNHVDPNVYG